MKLDDAATLARGLMNKHGLHDVPFHFDRARKRLGATHWRKNEWAGVITLWYISLSSIITQASEPEAVSQTMLHEIAHAIVGHKHAHDNVWLAKAREIGYVGGRTADIPEAIKNSTPWVGTCPAGHTVGRSREPSRLLSCKQCSSAFDSDHLFSWTRRQQSPAVAAQLSPKESLTTRKGHADCYATGKHPATPAGRTACRKSAV